MHNDCFGIDLRKGTSKFLSGYTFQFSEGVNQNLS